LYCDKSTIRYFTCPRPRELFAYAPQRRFYHLSGQVKSGIHQFLDNGCGFTNDSVLFSGEYDPQARVGRNALAVPPIGQAYGAEPLFRDSWKVCFVSVAEWRIAL
jgi:hypothetical protein